MSRRIWTGLLGLAGSSFVGIALSAEPSELDYFTDLPEVLTVTRLAQPISDTPGAVTILDRETIRRSGARDVADLLRLVPGYMVGGVNGSHPSVAYHAPLDDYGTRNLVFLDGRSVYSFYYAGGTFHGLMGVLIEDIERIEVLRGSNSAAFGANAMFGVINIITREATDTRGGLVVATQGEHGVRDGMARLGWGNETASFRLSAGQRQDKGWKGAYDDRRINQLHFRGDFRPAADQEILLTAGSLDMVLQDGAAGSEGNPFRTTTWRENFVNAVWRKQLSSTEEIKLSASYDEAHSHDRAPYAPDPNVMLDFGGDARKLSLELQHQLGLTHTLRMVWGLGYERNEVTSPPLLYRDDALVVSEARLFGNLEWRPHERWLVNAGGYWGRHSWSGSDFSPRLMANYQVVPDHTLRAGVSRSVRTPNLLELAADVRYYPKDYLGLIAARKFAEAAIAYWNIPFRSIYSDGTVQPEKLHTSEIGYFGNLRDLRMTLDIRVYRERMVQLIDSTETEISGYVTLPNPFGIPVGQPIPVWTFANSPGFRTRGIEYQLRWKPLPKTEVWLNQAFQKLSWDKNASADFMNMPPTHATTVAWFQELPYEMDFSLMVHSWDVMSWGNYKDRLPSQRRVDARLAWPFRLGSARGEMAITIQAANGNNAEYLLRRGYEFERRAFGTLRLEF